MMFLLDFTGWALQQEKQSMVQICSGVDAALFYAACSQIKIYWAFAVPWESIDGNLGQ